MSKKYIFLVMPCLIWCIAACRSDSIPNGRGVGVVKHDTQLSLFTEAKNNEIEHVAIPVQSAARVYNDEGTVKFSVVAQAFEQIERERGRLEMTKSLAELFKAATPAEAAIISYLSLGQLHPPFVGTQFQIAEKNLIVVAARLMGHSDGTIKHKAKQLGDLGSVLEGGGWKQTGDLTVVQVYHALEDIESVSGTGSQELKAEKMRHLLSQLDPLSAKFVARIVIGKLRLGFSDMTIIDALSWMEAGNKSLHGIIEGAYNVCADIGLIAQTLKESGVKVLERMKIKVGVPIRPAAAERLPTAQAIMEKLGDCVAQPKLDGFRLQIHLDKTHARPRVEFFSRNLLDMTTMFPDLAHAVAQLDVQDLVCEGEAIGYDPNTGSFLPFQETVKRKRKHGVEAAAEQMPLRVFVFDLLYLNGQEYLTKTHDERRKKLLSLFKKEHEETVQVVDERLMHTARELEDYFNQNIAAGLEGLVVKREDAQYQPGKRNFNWIKLKRQEEGHLEDTIDCVILGYYAGKGKRAHFGVGAFLVGVYNQQEDCFQTIAKIGTGMSDVEWKELKKKCDAHAVKNQPKNVVCAKELTPDVWCAPEMVCLIRADEITLSPLHTAGKTESHAGLALRFPRFMGYRADKSAEETTTVKEIKQMYKDQYGR
jgi:DNA ligase 1